MRLTKTYEQVSRKGKKTSLEVTVNYDHINKEVKEVVSIEAYDHDDRKSIEMGEIIETWSDLIDRINWWEVYAGMK